jgi:hypothetical protein
MSKVLMIDPEEGWKYGFPKPAPISDWVEDDALQKWLEDNGYPKGKVPHYIRYYEVEDEQN